MPPTVLEVFDPLKNELVNLHAQWALLREVFGKNEDQIKLLNRVNEIVFGYTQWAIYLDVILTLCRYTDPAESSKKIGHRPNLTLERLVNLVTADAPTFGSGLAANEWATVTKCRDNYFEEIRSKRIAHNDLMKMMVRFSGTPTNWPSREQVGEFLTLCTNLMDRVHQHYIGCPFVFDFHAYDGQRAGEGLIKVLEEFVRLHTAEVNAGRSRWMIKPPKEWLGLPPS
jgi:hypothetical protein